MRNQAPAESCSHLPSPPQSLGEWEKGVAPWMVTGQRDAQGPEKGLPGCETG